MVSRSVGRGFGESGGLEGLCVWGGGRWGLPTWEVKIAQSWEGGVCE